MIKTDIVYGSYPSSRLDLYDAGADAPLFIYFHGGGLKGGSKGNGTSFPFTSLMEQGISVVSAEYRMYPNAEFPDYLEDAAECVAWCKANVPCREIYIGGSSAGGYITMMLAFDSRYLGKYGIDCADCGQIAGYFCDAGQPTVHFVVLEKSGEDKRLIRLDERAPLWFIHEMENKEKLPRYALIVSDNDMYNRLEQNQLLYRTMRHMGYPESKLSFTVVPGFKHCGYSNAKKADGTSLFAEMISRFIEEKLPLIAE